MANYNVNMKQFNGADYDNILPHAYLADTATNASIAEKLGGGGTSDIVTLAREGLCRIATGSYVGNGVYTTPTTFYVGARPKLVIFYGLFTINPTYSGKKFVNGTAQNWSSFNVTCIRSTNMSLNTTYSSYDRITFTTINLIPDQTFLAFANKNSGNYGSFDEYVSITLSYNNGNVVITQTNYESFQNTSAFSQYDRRQASYQFNESGITYQWYALTEATT